MSQYITALRFNPMWKALFLGLLLFLSTALCSSEDFSFQASSSISIDKEWVDSEAASDIDDSPWLVNISVNWPFPSFYPHPSSRPFTIPSASINYKHAIRAPPQH
ncbi:hypothetical protein SAMN02745866_03084 [Alteromonadaceae bacterium Bs31]|nr:hypothetical protein SAMN02745866_03084 [Alteromonadaceae bacterium Bs31]